MGKQLTIKDLNIVKGIIKIVNTKTFPKNKQFTTAVSLIKQTSQYCESLEELKRKGIKNETSN